VFLWRFFWLKGGEKEKKLATSTIQHPVHALNIVPVTGDDEIFTPVVNRHAWQKSTAFGNFYFVNFLGLRR
jgi:hypothetical protein